MELELKPDFAEARELWSRFWEGRNERPAISAVLPKPDREPAAPPPRFAGRDGDVESLAEQVLAWADSRLFLGDAIPFHYVEFSADHFAALLGCDLVFPDPDEGGWPVNALEDVALDEVDIRFREESPWWSLTRDVLAGLQQRLSGKVLVAAPTLAGNLDALVALRGASQVLQDVMLDPDGVVRCLKQIDQAHAEVVDAFAELLDYDSWGSINRHGFYSTGRINTPQCDFSCMISPDMFNQFAKPWLVRELARLDGGIYHLNGPDALQHLEPLSELKELHVVQWAPGTADPGRDWSDVYARIDGLGKGQMRRGNADEVLHAWRELQTRRLFWHLDAQTDSEVERCLRECAATSK
jgi:5-methyltetrahydrofolate--homocysteine methyltransferase